MKFTVCVRVPLYTCVHETHAGVAGGERGKSGASLLVLMCPSLRNSALHIRGQRPIKKKDMK